MSWTERELKKRAAGMRTAVLQSSVTDSDSARARDLWDKFEESNAALPDALQLVADAGPSALLSQEGTKFQKLLRAPNGAALGFNGQAVRYVWPEKSQTKSNNFWIRWNAERQCYELSQRVSTSAPPRFASFRFDERRIEHMIKCLVLCNRVKVSAVRKSRLWPF